MNQHWIILSHHDYQPKVWNEAALLSQTPNNIRSWNKLHEDIPRFQVLGNIYSVQRPVFTGECHIGRVGTFSSRQSGPSSGFESYWFHTIALNFYNSDSASGKSKQFFCIFRRIYVQLPLACQVVYEWFSFAPLPQTYLKYFYLESSLGKARLSDRLKPGRFMRVTRPSLSWVCVTSQGASGGSRTLLGVSKIR